MFVKIKDNRIKVAAISEYGTGFSISQNSHFLRIKVSGKERLIHVDNQEELNRIVLYLDKALKVSEA